MNRVTTLLLATFLFVTSLSGQKVWSLSDCVEYALANHAEIRIAELSMKDADWQIKENRAIAYPQFFLSAHYQSFIQQPAIPAEAIGIGAPGTELTFALKKDLGANINYTQLIFNNSYLARIKAAKMYKDYAAIQFEGTVEKIQNKVTDAYIPALVVAEGVKILEKNIENQRKLVFETQANYAAGFVEQLDVDRLEFALSDFETDLESLLRQEEMLLDVLKFSMNMPGDETIALSDDVDKLLVTYGDINPEEEIDYMNRPDYVATLKAIELNEIQTDAYKKEWWPVLNFFASYDPGFQGNDELYWIPSAIAGIRLNMPIYDGGYAKSKAERSIIQTMKVDQQKRILTMSYDLQLETARKDYYSTKQKLEDKERNLRLAERIFSASETKFKQGVGSSFEVTQSQYGLYQSQADLVNARFAYLNSLIAFKKALGKNNF